MWTMMDSNNDHGRDQLKPPPDLVIGRKLRPLMPRPISSCTAAANHPYSSPSCCCTRNPKSLSWNPPMGPPMVSTRWNPTPEQLQALEEMYRRGIRTPSAEQIQQIAAKLGRFGKIEGKNVFYWFQNHKARERQKKRRQLELLAGKKMQHDTKQTGLGRRYFENEYHKKVSIPSNCGTPSEDSASMPGAVIAAECGKDGWPQLNHKELQHKLATAENEACWQLDLSSCLPPPPHPNNNSSINAITAHKATGQENTYSYASLNPITVFPNGSQNQNENEENQTLQLFPTGKAIQQDSRYSNFTTRTKITPSEFIEFLPIKN